MKNTPTIDSIMQKLKDKNPSLRESGLDELGSMNPPNAIDIILPFLSDTDSGVRETAAVNLGEIGDYQVIPYLISSFESEVNQNVCYYILRALEAYDDIKIHNFLINLVYFSNLTPKMGHSIAQQLSKYPSEVSIKALIHLLGIFKNNPYAFPSIIDSLKQFNNSSLKKIWQDLFISSFDWYAVNVAYEALLELNEDILVWLMQLLNEDKSILETVLFSINCLPQEQKSLMLIELEKQPKLKPYLKNSGNN